MHALVMSVKNAATKQGWGPNEDEGLKKCKTKADSYILQNLGGCPAFAKQDEQTSSQDGSCDWYDQGNMLAALNAWMVHIADGNKDTFRHADNFWSSSEATGYWPAKEWIVWFNTGMPWGRVSSLRISKAYGNDVRPVLAF